MMRLCAALLCLPGVAAADLRPVSYDDLKAQPHRIETFDTLPSVPEPGHSIDQHWRAPGLTIGERLVGQTVQDTDGFDALQGAATQPLRAIPGAPGQTFAIAHHAGFGSNALFPVGPKGADLPEGRGEGSAALVFDTPQTAIGLRLHAEYPDPLGQHPAPGTALLTFHHATGQTTELTLPLTHGVILLAWRSDTGITAVTAQNTDPGGIALDDILYDVTALSG
ncbi:MAG: hypothetical protein JJ869_05775 [Marivita sp.]|uniref:hypothetical protein n=1 Tax=Marivita sp. TaxID=2003365 RepID=UPI001B03F2CA|nr:hypothetical protein [Marivita sp.]MBO6883077.1 hypothetical protein [Marivita sp.]